ncbi:hypothetical protein ALO42_100844 [Pseudomonas syringae pv. atrofaciens]|nr:Uncharacterized protein AC518_0152 [Pseudomonas syringae pv. syringae]KPW12426.1 hypothetical protein ALO42_100844 [Pseudomonas syringae pv. atrofaciens]KPW15322.1 hypothetical protein ALO91_100945 [Pseudomonas syringae pv. aceris]KPX67377.1 hypothetical protein ALO39_100665 [Pseudomonas syringae pv. lapsa]KPY63294.1 hypothetical protein ALO46_100832 [Pseudomonas syringae pv. solidagae]KPY99080.1 hypothetical protein ALO85_100523 [Pseudomonas syringae pv. aptata]RML56836.1 hypothetical pro
MAGAAQDVGQLHGVCAKGTDDKELFANCGGGRHAAFLDDERSVLFRTCGAVSTIDGARLLAGSLGAWLAWIYHDWAGVRWGGASGDKFDRLSEVRR